VQLWSFEVKCQKSHHDHHRRPELAGRISVSKRPNETKLDSNVALATAMLCCVQERVQLPFEISEFGTFKVRHRMCTFCSGSWPFTSDSAPWSDQFSTASLMWMWDVVGLLATSPVSTNHWQKPVAAFISNGSAILFPRHVTIASVRTASDV